MCGDLNRPDRARRPTERRRTDCRTRSRGGVGQLGRGRTVVVMALPALFGGEDAGALASAIGRVVGAPACSAHAFLDELTSTILGTPRSRARNQRPAAKALPICSTPKRTCIAAAMPAGLSSLPRCSTSSRRPGRGGIDDRQCRNRPHADSRSEHRSARRRSLTARPIGVLLAALGGPRLVRARCQDRANRRRGQRRCDLDRRSPMRARGFWLMSRTSMQARNFKEPTSTTAPVKQLAP